MALYNEILVGRFNRFLQKLTGIKGRVPSPQLASEILPVLIIPSGIEDGYLQSWDRFGAGTEQGGVALQNALVRIRNPVGSNVIVVIESLVFSSNSATNVNIEFTAPGVDLAGSIGVITRDTRGRNQSTAVVTSGNNVPAGSGVFGTFGVATNVDWQVISTRDAQLVLNAGRTLEIKTLAAAGETLRFSVFWRERFLEDSERT